MLKRLWAWLWSAAPGDCEIVSAARLVKALDRQCPGWNEVRIIRRRDRPGGGIDMQVLQ